MEKSHNGTFYELLDIKINSTSTEIISGYKKKIIKFKKIKIKKNQILEIKKLKEALYVLLNKKLRLKYNKIINTSNEPVAVNNEIDDSLDSVFNIDNSWMKETTNDKNDNKIDIISNRIFSLSNLNKKPGHSTNDEINLRIPQQGRGDKKY